MVILIPNYYTRVMNTVDPRISEAIRLLAEALNIPVQKAGEMLYPSIEPYLIKKAG